MIYFVTNQQELFKSKYYTIVTVEESMDIIKDWKCAQADSETSGLDPYIDKLLLFQLGSTDGETQVVIDCTSVDIKRYKDFLESRYLEFHNGKFDLQFLYTNGIVPRKVYDTMIVEQLLYLGYPSGKGVFGGISYSLQAVAERRLGILLDKSVRGEIIWKGITESVILYAANDVKYLHKIMQSQTVDFNKKQCAVGAKLECDCVPVMAYLEWCGIKLDESKWKAKMDKDKANLCSARDKLNKFVVSNNYKQFFHIDTQGDLWEGFNDNPIVDINWDSPAQVIKFAKFLGFDTTTQDKKTGEDKDTVLEKELTKQKGINDEFLTLYFNYKEASKLVGTYGQGHLDLINPITGRLHTQFTQIGSATGRMSSGGGINESLSKLKKIPNIQYVNMQQLPHDAETRACFVAEPGNLWVSADFSAEESRLAADVYNDEEMKKEFTERTGDTHAMFAWAVFKKECQECGCKDASEVKKKAPQWRNKVKAVEFAYLFGAAAPTISKAANCTVEKAQEYIDTLDKFFKGRTAFVKKGSQFVRNNGYVLISPVTGHKVYWWDWEQWKERQKSFTPEFWEDYRQNHKGTGDEVAQRIRAHFQAASKYDRYALNSPTQGRGALILKSSMTELFNWIVDNNLFGKVKICVVVHDEINCEFPESLKEFPQILTTIMKNNAAKFCESLEIPASADVGKFWIH